MFRAILHFFKIGPAITPLTDLGEIESERRQRALNAFIGLTVGYGMFYVCRKSLSVIKGPLIDNHILEGWQVGVMGAMLYYSYAVGKLTNGFLSDRANVKRVMSFCLLLSAVINLMLGFTSSFLMFAVLWGLNGWFQSMGSAPSVVSLSHWFPASKRGTMYSLWSTSHSIGEGITYTAIAFVVSQTSWRWGFGASGLLCVVAAVWMYRMLSDHPRTYGLPSHAEKKKSEEESDATTVGQQQLQVLKNPAIIVIGLSSAAMYFCRYSFLDWGPFFLEKFKGYDYETANGFIGVSLIVGGILGTVAPGLISDKFFGSKRGVVTFIFGLLQVAGIALLMLSPSVYWADIAYATMFSFGTGGLLVLLGGLIAVDLAGPRAVGAAMGFIGIFSYMAGSATQDLINGFLIESSMIDGKEVFNFDKSVVSIWIGSAILSMVLASSVFIVGYIRARSLRSNEVE